MNFNIFVVSSLLLWDGKAERGHEERDRAVQTLALATADEEPDSGERGWRTGSYSVKKYGLDVLPQLREALGYTDIANLRAELKM
jgi:hypothetical protein